MLIISSVTLSCLTLCDPMYCSISGFPVHHQHPEIAQTCVHWVSDAIQPSHPLSSPSLPAFNFFPVSGSFPISQSFALGGQSIGVSTSALVLPMNIQDWFPLRWACLISLQSKGLSTVFINTTVQKHEFFGIQLSLWSNSHIHTWLLEKTIALIRWTFVSKVMSLLFNMLSRLVITFLQQGILDIVIKNIITKFHLSACIFLNMHYYIFKSHLKLQEA